MLDGGVSSREVRVFCREGEVIMELQAWAAVVAAVKAGSMQLIWHDGRGHFEATAAVSEGGGQC